MPDRHAVIALSGGMDSTTAVAIYAHRDFKLTLVSFDYGQRHGFRELAAAQAVAGWYGAAADHHVIDMRAVGAFISSGSALTDPAVDVPDGHYAEATMKQTIVNNRNSILYNVLVGGAIARRAEVVVVGVHAGDHAIYPDCRPAFVHGFADLVQIANEGNHPPRVDAPFLDMTKADIARIGADLGAPLELTWSCYKGGEGDLGEEHCGTCGTCYERREAFELAGVPDPTRYRDNTTRFPEPQVAG